MSEAEDQGADAPKTTAIVPVKERLVTHNPVAIWDTAELEHMGRVGAIMAESGLASETFFKDGDQPASAKMVVARMVMVANIAREVEADPLMFLQTCSIISRKLHIEGKAVNAIIRKRTGVILQFRFGAWNTDHIEFPPLIAKVDEVGNDVIGDDGNVVMVPDPAFFHGIGERLAVHCYDPNDPERYVEGSVGLWKTTRNGSPWTSQGNWRRQLRYRAAPEWARAYEPGAVLGIFSDVDEDFETAVEASRTSGLMARLPGTQGASPGFSKENVEAHTTRSRKKAKPEPTPEPEGDVIDGETGEVLEERPTSTAAPTETATAPSVESEPASSDSATDAPSGSAEETPSPTQPEEPSSASEETSEADFYEVGHAARDEVYYMVGDTLNEEGRRITYKNGERFSSSKSADITVYGEHAPEVDGVASADTIAESPQISTEADQAPDATSDLPPELGAFVDKVENSGSWIDIKAAMADFLRGDYFKALPLGEQNGIRANIYDVARENCSDLPDHAADVSVFRLWIEWIEGPDACDGINGTYAILQKSPSWAASASAHNAIDSAVAARLAALRA